MVKQEEEVHGKKRAFEKLKTEEKDLNEEIKKTEKEIERLEEEVKIASELDEETREKLEILEEAEKHMKAAETQFENANEEYSNVTENYLEPLRLNLELPDYSRLEKPRKPPVPEVPPAPAVMQQHDHMNGAGGIVDPAMAFNSWGANDAFGVSSTAHNSHIHLISSLFHITYHNLFICRYNINYFCMHYYLML